MFDSLSGRLQGVFRGLRGLGRISEANVGESLREVRMALLEADVNFRVARDFVEGVKVKALGERVVGSVLPGQQFVKIVQDELVGLLGGGSSELVLEGEGLASVLMVGLHGSGKTTSSGKLARLLLGRGRRPLLVGADVYRPAAMEQLGVLGERVGVPVLRMEGERDVLRIAREAVVVGEREGCDVLVFDTAGRLQVDEALVGELVRLRDLVLPREVLLVLDAATGQEAVSVAGRFDEALGVSGCVLTKLDGDARGGGALSMRAVTGRAIKFVGTGEGLDDFEVFHPERMASRILGMGDVVSLVERAAEVADEDEAKRLEARLRRGDFSLEDFLGQLRQMRKMGSLESIVGMLPGGGGLLPRGGVEKQEREFRRMEAMICAMTPLERSRPQVLNARRRQRIAAGSGVRVAELNNLLSRFGQMRKAMRKMGRGGKKGKMNKMLKGLGGGGFPGGGFPGGGLPGGGLPPGMSLR